MDRFKKKKIKLVKQHQHVKKINRKKEEKKK